MRRERTEEFFRDARSEEREMGENNLAAAARFAGLGADDISRAAGGVEAADALAHGAARRADAAHLAEERGYFIGLQEYARTLHESVFDSLAGRERLGDGFLEVDEFRETRVGFARSVFADAAFAEHDDVEVGVCAVRVGVGAA